MMRGVILETERLIIRNWTRSEEDRAFLHFIQSNEMGRRFYPMRLTRAQSDASMERILDPTRKLVWGAAVLKETNRLLGFTGLSQVPEALPFAPSVEIGWQYDPSVWGEGYASEAARELLRHGFEDVGLSEIVAFAVKDNAASLGVMRRIAMKRVECGDFDHPGVPHSHPHLMKHCLYRIARHDWEAMENAGR